MDPGSSSMLTRREDERHLPPNNTLSHLLNHFIPAESPQTGHLCYCLVDIPPYNASSNFSVGILSVVNKLMVIVDLHFWGVGVGQLFIYFIAI